MPVLKNFHLVDLLLGITTWDEATIESITAHKCFWPHAAGGRRAPVLGGPACARAAAHRGAHAAVPGSLL